MDFLRKFGSARTPDVATPGSTKDRGDWAETQVLTYLQAQGLSLVQRNYRTAGRGGGEIDLIMRAVDGTLVFVEVRQRRQASHGGAAGSVGWVKQGRIVFAARQYLQRFGTRPPPCRFDVVTLEDGRIEWLRAAFEVS